MLVNIDIIKLLVQFNLILRTPALAWNCVLTIDK